jgi:hypothetical protein
VLNTLLVAVSVIIALALMEFGLRMIGFTHLSTWRFDRITGKSLLPHAQMWNTEEGQALVQINSDGQRDGEHAVAKPADTLRIAVLGDSYAEAAQVPVEQAFWRVMQDTLSECPTLGGRQVEVLNFGVSGFGTAQELLTLQHKVWKYSPDIVVLAFLTGNDIRNNIRELQRGGNQPYFIYRQGELVLDDSFLDKSKSRLMASPLGDWWFAALSKSRVLQLLVKVSNAIDQLAGGQHKDEHRNTQLIYEQGLDNEIYSPPTDPLWIEAWRVTEDLVRMMHTEVAAHDATLVLVTLSNGFQVNPDQHKRQEYADSLGVDDLLYPDRRMEQLAREEAIEFVMLAPPLLAWAQEHRECVHGFDNTEPCSGHWNAQGHREAGKLIAQSMCQSYNRDPQ